MLENILHSVYSKYDQKTSKKEDNAVIQFFDNLSNSNNLNYLEVGSGLCRFPLLVQDRYKNIKIKCIEINNDLVEFGMKKKLNVFCGDIIKTDFSDQEFDIIHCSHVIEHLDYERVSLALDEMFRILKNGGYLIIRSPLMYPGFYFNIDHIRPYPPESILSYFNYIQQQKVGSYKILEIYRWYRKEAYLVYNSNHLIVKFANFLFRLLWLSVSFPGSKPNGYVLIVKKI